MDQGEGAKTISVFGVFPDGTVLVDGYTGVRATVTDGKVSFTTSFDLLLLGEAR
jgi:hypothetical protein